MLFKPNINSLLAKSYPDNTNYGFSIFYIFVNIGCFLGQLFIGFAAKNYDYNLAFFIAFLAILLAFFIFISKQANFANSKIIFKKTYIKYFILFAIFLIIFINFDIYTIGKILSIFCIILPIIFYAFIYKKAENKTSFALLGWYFLIAIIAYFLIFQSFNTLNILTNTKINNELFSFKIPSTWYVSFMFFSSFFISLFFSKIMKTKQINEAIFISFALLLASLAFIFAGIFADNLGVFHILFVYFLLGISQLIIGVLGSSLVSKLAPKAYQSSSMGLWFLCSASAQGIEAFVVKLIDFISFSTYFFYQGLLAFIVSITLLCFNKSFKI